MTKQSPKAKMAKNGEAGEIINTGTKNTKENVY